MIAPEAGWASEVDWQPCHAFLGSDTRWLWSLWDMVANFLLNAVRLGPVGSERALISVKATTSVLLKIKVDIGDPVL